MKKIVKIKEYQVLEIIDKLIAEQASGANEKTVSAAIGNLGTHPTFEGIRDLAKELKKNVESVLRSSPYKTDPSKGALVASRNGENGLRLTVNLISCAETERLWYFDGAIAIYNNINSDADAKFKSQVNLRASQKAQGFAGSENKVIVISKNTISLEKIKNLNPATPDVPYKLYILLIGAGKPAGYLDLLDEPNGSQEKSITTPQPTQAPQPTQTPQPNQSQETSPSEVTKTVSGTFESFDGDTAHNFRNLEDKLGPALKEIYDMKINPKIVRLTAKITRSSGNKFTTSYEAIIGNSPDGKAWMGFTSRGSFGDRYVERANGQISGSENKDGKSLEEKLTAIGAGEIETITVYEDKKVPVKQYFVQFTKPKEFPPHK